MDANARRPGGSTRGTLGVALTVVALVAVVAIASGGSVPHGAIGARRPSEGLLDTAVSLFVVAMALGTVLVVVMLSVFGRRELDGVARKRPSTLRSLITLLVGLGLLGLAVRVLGGSVEGRLRPPSLGRDAGAGGTDSASSSAYEPQFALWPVLAVGALAALALAAWWLAARGRRSTLGPPPTGPEEALADVLAETLDDLRAETDARRAVIRAYGRMERALAASGLARAPAEAPEEYLVRVLADLPVSRGSAARLTALFAWARFSGHDVRPEMKDEAIDTLEQVQRELAADALRAAALPMGVQA
jgi:hypothetical protein